MGVETAIEIHPFQVGIPEDELAELQRRIEATRWPSQELVADRSQGVQLATLQALARYWTSEYDWRKCEARLNALPQFTTEIDGVDIHFIHVRSRHENALPLIMTHGWPGSVIELLETVGPLTDPTAHGGSAEDAFDLVLPSLPGYGFSGSRPSSAGMPAAPHALGGADAPPRLHPLRRPGRRRGCPRYGPDGPPGGRGFGRLPPEPAHGSARNRRSTAQGIRTGTRSGRGVREVQEDGFGYFLEMATRPQTIGYAVLDSPVALAAWLLDHDTDSYYKISRAFVDGDPVGNLTRDTIVDNITLYWLTGTAASAARSYWEDGRASGRGGCQRPASTGGHRAGRLHDLPRRDLGHPAQLGRGSLPRPRLLQRG